MAASVIELRDSRRLTGPNLLLPGPGAVIDARLPGALCGQAVEAWRGHATEMLRAVGWTGERLAARRVADGVMLAFSAPIDALYAATEVNEWAWAMAAAELGAAPPEALEPAAARLRSLIDAERNPALIALRDAAVSRHVAFLSDDELASVGLGAGSRTWPVTDLPRPDQVEWSGVHDVPVALVTGTNGKTTTVRMLAAVGAAAGSVVGMTTTDGVVVDGVLVESGDYSGPGGGRRVLRDPRVTLAVLETARGGMLRRGLTVERADAAAVTNVAEDHLGEFGVHDARALAEVKLVVARAVHADGALVLNADEALLRELGPRATATRPAWFSLEAKAGGAPAGGARTLHVERGAIVCIEPHRRLELGDVASIPATLGGAADHNVANALAAAGLALGLGVAPEGIRRGLEAFDPASGANPGRGQLRTIGGVRVVVDFAHNPHGMAAMVRMARALPARRRHLVLGQAGDRDDASIAALAAAAAALDPARVVIKEMREYLRGRPEGEVPRLLEGKLRACGIGHERIAFADGDVEAARVALSGAQAGDLVLLFTHADRAAVEGLLTRLHATDWRPGQPIERSAAGA